MVIDVKLPAIFHGFAVEAEDEVAHAETGLVGGASGRDICQHHTLIAFETQPGGQRRSHGLRSHTNLAPTYATGLSDLFKDRADDVARRSETGSGCCGAAAQQQCIDTHQTTAGIDERPTAVS